MLESAAEYLNANATLLFFSILALGYFVGKLGFGEFRLGAVAGVLFVGLFFGHFGFEMGPAAQTFGFSIFIFAVGYEAGPQFFEVMRTDGLRYLSLALVVVITGVLLTLMLTRAFDFQPGISAGLLGGALTTTPTLAAAQEALRTGNAIPPDGFPVQQAIDNAGAAYAITYLFGVIGLILLLKLLPRLLKIDLPAQAAALKVSETNAGQQAKNMVPRTYRVLRDRYSVHEVEDYAGRLRVMQVRRSDEALEFELTTRLEIGDEILVLGTPGAFVSLPADRFTETADVANFDTKLESVAVIIEKPALVGKSLSEISARRGPAGVFILGIQRMRVELPLESDIVLQKGDVVRFLGNEAVVKRAASMVGHVERDVDETDLLSVAIGIGVGILVGSLTVSIAGVSIGLGSAGGLLAAGLAIGFLYASAPRFGRIPDAALSLLKELGLLMFMTGVGISAGGQVVETLRSAGLPLVLCGITLTVTPVVVAYAFGRKVLGLNPALLLGGIAGSMTSGAALKVVQDTAKSAIPALGYTSAYTFANVFLTIAGSVLPLFD
jgi:putative transport protein